MTMKTPEQIARETREAFLNPLNPSPGLQVDMLHAAIEADRAQRQPDADEAYRNGGFDNTLAAAIYDCLTDRETDEANLAAEWVAENENHLLWDLFAGPMLDRIEQYVRGFSA